MDPREQASATGAQLRRLRQHLRQRPDDGHAWLALARELARSAPGPELHHAIEQAIRSLPEQEAPWRLACLLHQQRGGARAALQWLEGVVRQNPGLQAPRVVLASLRGDALRLQGRWQAALQQYREAAATRPDDPALLNNMGSCLASLADFEEAERCFRRALAGRADFAEARLNLGFLRACQSRDGEALREIDAALSQPDLPQDARDAARRLRALLAEQGRLAPSIANAVDRGEVGKLQRALEATPEALGGPHQESVTRLRELADRCLGLEPPPAGAVPAGRGEHFQLLEAFAQCKLSGGTDGLAALCRKLREGSAGGPEAQRFLHALEVIRARQGCDPALLAGPDGEAWLRYWHARLVGCDRYGRPGQYKLSTNLVDGHSTTPAECVAATLRLALREILPGLPAGWTRGLFLYIAVNFVHGFGDGNGRLARFLLAWATESAGAVPLTIPLELRSAAANALSAWWRGGDLRLLLELLQVAHDHTARDLERLQVLGVRAPAPGQMPPRPLV